MTDLLPCPFCGSSNLRYEFCGSQGYIECNECCTQGPCDERAADPICDPDAACDAWNRRAALAQPEPPADGEVAELVVWLRYNADYALQKAATATFKRFHRAADLLERLAQPEPQGPTDEELWKLYDEIGGAPEDSAWCANYARAVLARWGRPAIGPVSVSERLPRPEDCDGEGRCWYFFMDSVVGGCGWQMFNEEENELLAPSHFWLPHWALPVPKQEAEP